MAKINVLVSPFVKWVGGKRQLLPAIKTLLPANIHKYKYVEPFVGGGAVLFHLQPNKALINDFNEELINVYLCIKNNVDDLIESLRQHKNEAEYFYAVRALDRSSEFSRLSDIERASRIIFLNKTCFNGLYRVNNSGEFNAPFGRYKSPNIVNEPVLRAVHNYLSSNNIEIIQGSYESVLSSLKSNAFVYLDPPYHPVSETSNFTGYIQGGWGEDEQISLREKCDKLNSKGIKFLLSNSYSDFTLDQYKNYDISIVEANRMVNANSNNRGGVREILVKNYE